MTFVPQDHGPGWFAHPGARSWRCAGVTDDVRAFHAGLSGYRPTALIELPALAAELGAGRVFVKDESDRLGLPAFKALGVTWAVHAALAKRPGATGVLLVTATDGNHGRALARTARGLGHRAHIVVPDGVHPAAVDAIRLEGATVEQVPGSYDDAVRHAAVVAQGPEAVLVQDTAWPGYEEIPARIVEGYTTLFVEIDEQLAAASAAGAGLVVVPVGVGSLAQAAVTHYRSRPSGASTALLAVEPDTAAGALASLQADEPVSVPTGQTLMAGLNCGTPSSLAWPFLRDGLDAAVAVPDGAAAEAARDLVRLGVSSGPCGAATLAAARATLTGEHAPGRRAALDIGQASTVVLVNTEGAAANPYLDDDPPLPRG